MSGPTTLYDKIWNAHLVKNNPDGTSLIYVDRHLVHEVTSPQAFEGLRMAGRKVRRPDLTLATPDHNVPTSGRADGIDDEESRIQVDTLRANAKEFGVPLFDMMDPRQGVVHIVGPEQGFTVPGATIVCGDSHTSTHGAFGALAFGIGTSDVEHTLATQTLILKQSKNMLVEVTGELGLGVTAKDVILAIIGAIGTAGGTGHVIEFAGNVIEELSMEGRMTVCNMTIEGGARAGLIAPDQKTFDYLKGRPMAPAGDAWEQAVAYWSTLKTDEGAQFDKVIQLKAEDIAPQVTWGTSPEDVVGINDTVPAAEDFADENKQIAAARSLDYMGLSAGTPMTDVKIDAVFIGSCTNGRIEDFREVAKVVEGKESGRRRSHAIGSRLRSREAAGRGRRPGQNLYRRWFRLA